VSTFSLTNCLAALVGVAHVAGGIAPHVVTPEIVQSVTTGGVVAGLILQGTQNPKQLFDFLVQAGQPQGGGDK
jgi:hypothetical protein